MSQPNDLETLLNEIRRLTNRSDIPRRVELCRAALELVKRDTQPEQWAELQNILGYSLAQNPFGDRANNLEQAINHFQQLQEVYTRQATPFEWAMSMNNLAAAYYNRIRGERADNLERAISYCEQSLEVWTRQAFPEQWARRIYNLANTYLYRIRGERAENLERAIGYYEQSLEVYTRQATPKEWAQSYNNLALAYYNRIRGERADNLERAIGYYEQSLEVYTRQATPKEWANSINNLAVAYLHRIREERAENLELAIDYLEQSLEVYTRQATPKKWANSINNLAAAYNLRIRGERAQNLDRAIDYCQQSLEVYTRQATPKEWASSINNLAVAYLHRIREERAENLERAIDYLEQSLEVYTRQTFPFEWAQSMNNLANAYNFRIKGEPAENLERAINYYEQSLEVYTRQTFPFEWARSMNNLALAYHNRIRGERADNIERAIEYYEQSLEVYTCQAFPYEWAQSCYNLAIAYSDRIKRERADNLERAIDYLKQSLEVYTRQAFPEQWAQSCNNLALAYHNRIRGERAENIERAIDYYRQTQKVWTRQAAPFEWASSMNNLAAAYLHRIRGERADNLERAISYCEQLQEVCTHQARPKEWAGSMNNLAAAYLHRIRGERADNLERTIGYCEQSLEVYTRQGFPYEWAQSCNNLALAYNDRIRGERAENIERAIEYYKQSLEVYTRQGFPFEWARSMNNLANAYNLRIKGERADNIERAINYYEQSLEVWTRQAAPFEWATSMSNLANAYSERIRGEHADNLERAIDYYELSQKVWTHQGFPFEWARSMSNLALAYNLRIRGERADNIEPAINCYEQSLEVYTPQSFPQDCRNTAYRLGRLLYDERRFAEAREAFVMAHKAVEALRGEVSREGARRELADKNADLYAHFVFCCLHDANADEEAAFEYAAAGKGRVFADLLASARFDLSAVGDDDPAFTADWERYREFRQQIDNLLVQLTGDKGGTRGMTGMIMQRAGETSGKQESERIPSTILYEQLRATQEKAAKHWEEMTFRYPALTACESAPTLTAQDARELSAQLGATLVEYYQHAKGWCAFVVTPDEVRYVALPDVTDELLEEMSDWTEDIRYLAGRTEWTIEMLDDWHEAVMAPLNLSALGGRAAVVLSGFGTLRRLPLFAARDPKSKRYIAQECELAFVPSLGALRVSHQLRIKGQPSALKQLLSVAYPGTPPLENVIPEAKAVTKCFPNASSLHSDAATPLAVLEHAHDKQAIHLGCHGRFDAQHEQESGLMLAGGWLTVQRIIAELALKECQLVTLAACESWVLTQAIMTAGAPTVVSSQWVVNDSATRALFEAFYAHLTNGDSPANALRQATELIRKQKGWQHPFYWAAFNTSGLAHEKLPKASQQSSCPLEGLGEQVETINRNSTRGEMPMDAKRIKREAQIYLKGIGKTYHKISPNNNQLVLNWLTALRKQASTTKSESQLLTLCDSIHKLAEEMPALRDLLILKGSDVDQMQKDRFFTIEGFNKTSAQQQADSKALATLQQQLTKTQNKLEAHIKRLEELQAKNEQNQ